MSEHEPDEATTGGGPSFLGSLMTPKAAAIAGFAFAVLSMTGQGTWSMAVQTLFWGSNFPQSQVTFVLGSWAVATLVIAALGWLLARRTLSDAVAADSWEGHLARAATLVAGVGAVLSVLGILGSLVHLGS